jgi:hypothetical protein
MVAKNKKKISLILWRNKGTTINTYTEYNSTTASTTTTHKVT